MCSAKNCSFLYLFVGGVTVPVSLFIAILMRLDSELVELAPEKRADGAKATFICSGIYGVVCLICFLYLVISWYLKKRKNLKQQKEKTVSLEIEKDGQNTANYYNQNQSQRRSEFEENKDAESHTASSRLSKGESSSSTSSSSGTSEDDNAVSERSSAFVASSNSGVFA